MEECDVVVIGAGAAGLMCARVAGDRGRRILLLDHSKRIGHKIRISGGGRCNFTNLYAAPENFLSQNPHFCKSALKRYTQHDFIELVDSYGIAWHEKKLGQLFCDGSAAQVVQMLLDECERTGVDVRTEVQIESVTRHPRGFLVTTSLGEVTAESVVIATGGKSIPKMGATGFGYEIARQFGLGIVEPRPALVPFTLDEQTKARLEGLSGIAVESVVQCGGAEFAEAVLLTHRGLNGPAILQISSYWRAGDAVQINLAPGCDVEKLLLDEKTAHGRHALVTPLASILPRRLAQRIGDWFASEEETLGSISHTRLREVAGAVSDWRLKPGGTEGYRTAEVTLGGVDTDDLSSKTMEARHVPGLYFIGEVVDVTGHLGGYNFQWAWSSGHAAGQSV
jgi:hypothetical protein